MRTHSKFRYAVIVGLVVATAVGCKRDRPKPVLPGDDRVLAQVNGHAITEYDLAQAAARMLGPAARAELDQATRKNLLEGLVRGRAIADTREKELSVEERMALDKQAAAYREELLVKQYLSKHTKPAAISSDLVARYYEDHADEFTPPKLRTYEVITSTRPVVDLERTRLLTAMREPGSHEDWSGWAGELAKKGVPVAYQRGIDSSEMLDGSLRAILARLRAGEASSLTFLEGRALVARVIDEKALPARPLSEVSAEIRRALQPVQVRESVKRASEIAMKDAKVEYR